MEDKTAFDRMFKEWYEQMVYLAYYFVNDTEVSKDIVSDAFEYFWCHFDKIEESTAKKYLCSMVRSRCMDYLRHQSVHEDYVDFALQLSQRATDTADSSIREERLNAIHKAMEKLTPYNSHILQECYLHKKKYKEVADELHVSVAAIHKNIVKALRVLREELVR